MRTSTLCIVVVGLVSCAPRQTTPNLTGISYGPGASPTKITANEIRYDESKRTTYARGNVRIVSEVSTITADEADVHLLNFSRVSRMSVDLRGNVRVLIDPSTR
jgi:lipopolysaccharide assembly outer membrane protein LptD (OstA)